MEKHSRIIHKNGIEDRRRWSEQEWYLIKKIFCGKQANIAWAIIEWRFIWFLLAQPFFFSHSTHFFSIFASTRASAKYQRTEKSCESLAFDGKMANGTNSKSINFKPSCQIFDCTHFLFVAFMKDLNKFQEIFLSAESEEFIHAPDALTELTINFLFSLCFHGNLYKRKRSH